MLNLTLDLNEMTPEQLAHMYLAIVKMGRLREADLIFGALSANCGDESADAIIGVLNVRAENA